MVRDARQAGNVADSSRAQQAAPAARPGRRVSLAGWSFAQFTLLPVLLVLAGLLPGVALLLAGQLRPAPLLLIAVPLAVIMITAVTHRVPGWRLVPVLARAGQGKPVRAWAGWWGLGGTLAVAIGYGAWQILLNSPQIIVLREPGAAFQVGYWIAGHGSLPITQSLAAFGGAHAGLSFASAGFGTTVAGASGSAVASGSAAGSAARAGIAPAVHARAGHPAGRRLVDPRHATAALVPPGARGAGPGHLRRAGRAAGWPAVGPGRRGHPGLTLPEQYTSRAAFPEPLLQILLLRRAVPGGGLADGPRRPRLAPATPAGCAGRTGCRPRMAAAALGGLALGLASLVSLGALPLLIPVIPFLGAAGRGPAAAALPLGLGVLAGAGVRPGRQLAGRAGLAGRSGLPGAAGQPARGVAAVLTVAVLARAWPAAGAGAGSGWPGARGGWRLPEAWPPCWWPPWWSHS